MKLSELLDAHVRFRCVDEPKVPDIFYDPGTGKHYWFEGWCEHEVDISKLDPNATYEVLDA